MASPRPLSEQEIHGRRGRPITDRDATDISRVEELSYELKVQEVMTADVRVASPDMPVSEVLEILRTNRISGVPVLENEQLQGVISIEDVVRAMRDGELSAPVSEYMTRKLVTVLNYDPIVKALQAFTESRLGRLVVVDENGRLAGMITKGDITRGVLLALQRDYKEEELRRYRASHLFEDIVSDRTTLVLRYNIKAQDFIRGGYASSHIKRALLRLGADPQIARRCGIAVYEAEMNLIIHTNHGGVLKTEVEPHRITMSTVDDGPGIPNIEQVLQAGYSTASEQVREMGFGAGMGLVNIKRCVDKMEIESAVGKGTRLTMRIHIPSQNSSAQKD
ncbi:MAG: CBS domain-containing protein [Chloroflexi bacterium]|nr:CBS domain-containing protein [Chloroflexota bacterium]MCA2002523.1 CBS domain-containing protein [Chloroflexota bacterium]